MPRHLPAPTADASVLRDASPPSSTTDATKARLLDAAESLLAERGFEGMSIRALAARASTSISAAHYHFGSKLALVSAVFEARIEPINAERLERLERVLADAGPRPPRLEDVVDTLVRPGFEAWRHGEALGRPATPHILAQLHAERASHLDDLKQRLFEPLMDRYLDVLERILPGQDRGVLRVGLSFVIGMMLHVVGGHLDWPVPAEAPGRPEDDEDLLARLIAFAAAGLQTGSATVASSTASAGSAR